MNILETLAVCGHLCQSLFGLADVGLSHLSTFKSVGEAAERIHKVPRPKEDLLGLGPGTWGRDCRERRTAQCFLVGDWPLKAACQAQDCHSHSLGRRRHLNEAAEAHHAPHRNAIQGRS